MSPKNDEGDRLNQFLDTFFFLRREPLQDWPRWKRAVYHLYRLVMLLCAGICMGLVLLVLAIGPYSREILPGYFSHWQTLLLNTLPVVVLIFLMYALTGRAWAAFLTGGGIALGFSLGNYYKLQFRDDPLYFEDMLILREAKAMATGDHYSLFVDKKILLVVLCWLLGIGLLCLLVRGRVSGWKRRLPVALASVLIFAAAVPVYLSSEVYNAVDNYEYLNQWSATQNYISKGFFYPFIHSIEEFVETPPSGYSEKKAEALLAEYPSADIPADRQVNVISIMREAYVDFSRYGIEGLDVSGYDLYHQLEEESYRGDLLTNIFAGGTVDSERCFLTGNYQLRNFRSNANSYLWYFRDQGYTVEGSHPYYQWFYNRLNINGYLGFERYRFLEGDYETMTSAYLPEDYILYPEVYKDYVANKSTGKPYFSFNLNVQSHGPYSTTTYNGAVEYLTGSYTDGCKNAMNNYMASIMDGDVQLMKLIDRLRADSDPVVLVLFSDHLPWMGDGNVFYDEMGMDIDPGTEEGFRTHYTTRYLIWANDAAKEVLGSDFVGEGPTISPCYLMNLLFEQCGWEGPAFMQAMDDLRQVFPVVTTHGCYVVDGVFTDTIPAERQELFDRFLYLQHYWRNEFLY